MSQPQDIIEAVGTALDVVTGLRVQTKAGKAHVPGVVVELDRINAPVTTDGAVDYAVRVLLLVQMGEFRNSLERIWDYADPAGSTSTSVFAALLSYGPSGDVVFDGPGLVEYGGQQYGGGVFTVEVFA